MKHPTLDELPDILTIHEVAEFMRITQPSPTRWPASTEPPAGEKACPSSWPAPG